MMPSERLFQFHGHQKIKIVHAKHHASQFKISFLIILIIHAVRISPFKFFIHLSELVRVDDFDLDWLNIL